MDAWAALETKLDKLGTFVRQPIPHVKRYLNTYVLDLRFQDQALPTKGRPQIVALWFKNRRALRLPLGKDPESEIGSKTVTWWRSLQPDWRVKGIKLVREGPEFDRWETLMKGGASGIVTIMVCLAAWGLMESAGNAEYDNAVSDVAWTFRTMSESLDNPSRAVAGGGEEEAGKKAKRLVVLNLQHNSLSLIVLPASDGPE